MGSGAENKEKPDGLLKQLAGVSDTLFSSGFEIQCGAICYRRKRRSRDIEVLLVTSRESGRWIIPKGWQVKGETLWRSAEIEAWEEAGVRGKARKKPLGRYTYVKSRDRQLVPCIVDVYLVEALSVEALFPEQAQRQLEWVTCAEAASRVREPELKGLLLQAEQKLRKR